MTVLGLATRTSFQFFPSCCLSNMNSEPLYCTTLSILSQLLST
ncbi:MAG: hypothetical protein N3E41_08710 [Thermofilaceae archaeon]|nr:hypothetical protein [Thermofilaceae archaeon]